MDVEVSIRLPAPDESNSLTMGGLRPHGIQIEMNIFRGNLNSRVLLLYERRIHNTAPLSLHSNMHLFQQPYHN